MGKILIIDMNFNKNSIFKKEFVEPILNILKIENVNFEIKHFLEDFNFSKYEKIIFSGVPLKDFEYEKYLYKFNWILDYSKPILGICAGGQIIVKIFGGEIIENKEIGLFNLNLENKDIIIDKLNFPLEIYALHKKSFNLPKNFICILKNNYPQLIKHKNKEIFACAFHPEVKNHEIIKNFLKI